MTDLRFTVRTLVRSPWFAALAVVILALSIGGTKAAYVPARRAVRTDPMAAMRYE